MIKIRHLLATLLLSFVCLPSFAMMTIYIVNNTDQDLNLIDYSLDHGVLYTFPPQQVVAHETWYMQLDDSGFRGPDITLTYASGSKNNRKVFKVRSQENIGILWAGKITTELLEADPCFDVTNNVNLGSVFFSQSSLVRWIIDPVETNEG